MNAAQQIHAFLGVAVNESGKVAESNKNESATKRGPGREHRGGKPGNRLTKQRPQRAYVALMQAAAQKRITKAALRDEHGALVLIGKPYELVNVHPTTREFVLSGGVDGDDFFYTVQRKWLAGVSERRGY